VALYPNSRVLVETDWLASHLDDSTIRVVEVDEFTEAYDTAHIPGAITWHWQKDLHDPLKRDFVGSAELQKLLGDSGVGTDTTVILYGGNDNWFAAYAYWYLKYQGFDTVKLLNGGRKKWQIENRPMTAERPTLTATSPPRLAGPRPEIRAVREEVLSLPGGREAVLIDVRSPEEFRGEMLAPPHLPQEQAQVPGHIPGARNIPWSKAADEDGTFKSPEELKELYETDGTVDGKEIIAYCRIGERSSHTWFVVHELLGHENSKNYDGSWTEYGSLVGVPVER
jgi:thiosulfate/3-mercaptopyruvate sulfurtransferase